MTSPIPDVSLPPADRTTITIKPTSRISGVAWMERSLRSVLQVSLRLAEMVIMATQRSCFHGNLRALVKNNILEDTENLPG